MRNISRGMTSLHNLTDSTSDEKRRQINEVKTPPDLLSWTTCWRIETTLTTAWWAPLESPVNLPAWFLLLPPLQWIPQPRLPAPGPGWRRSRWSLFPPPHWGCTGPFSSLKPAGSPAPAAWCPRWSVRTTRPASTTPAGGLEPSLYADLEGFIF